MAAKGEIMGLEQTTAEMWWIDEDRVAGSANPTDRQLKRLRAEGFATIINLLDGEKPRYNPTAIKRGGFELWRIPIQDFTPPTQEQFLRFFDFVDGGLARGKVLVHCMGGYGRTGTMGAAYWIREGLTAAEAIDRIRSKQPHAIEVEDQVESLRALELKFRPHHSP